jgi:hypothetical protein
MTSAKMMDYMRANMDAQNDAYVGIFWYDKNAGELFGVDKMHSMEKDFNINGLKTSNTLHKDFWRKQYHKDTALGRVTKFRGDYPIIPRGRVWERKGKGFAVTVGDWIKDKKKKKKLILIEFDLPENTEFIIDPHWDIGSGWSGEKLG